MKYVPGPEVGLLSRSQGNTTASHNRGGAYLRNRVVPVNPGTITQLARRALMVGLTQGYRSLTDAQRAGWTALGAQLERLDSLGQPYTLTGSQAYISVNFYRQLTGTAIISSAPAFDSAPILLTCTLTATVTGGVVSIAFTPSPLPAGTRFQAYATPGLSAGKYFFGHPGVASQSPGLYKQIGFSAVAQASPYVATAPYAAIFGPPLLGTKISTQLVPLSANFLPGNPIRCDTVVTP